MTSQQYVNDLISALPINRPDKLEDRLERLDIKMHKVFSIDKKYNRNQYSIEDIDSVYLNDNEDFNWLKSEIIRWNKEVDSMEANKQPFLQFRNQMYNQLEQQLYQLSNTKNQLNQNRFLQDIKFWYEMQLDTLKKGPKKTQEPEPFRPKRISMNNSANTSEEQFKHRTKYSNIEPAEDRVKEFGRKMPGSMMQNFDSFAQTRPTTTQYGNTSQNWFTNSLMKNRQEDGARPGSNVSNFRLLMSSESPQRQIFSRNLGSAESQFRPDTQDQRGFKPIQSSNAKENNPWQYQNTMNFNNFKPIVLPKETQNEDDSPVKNPPPSMVPNQKTFLDDRQTQIAYMQDQEQEFKKYNEMKSAYSHYVPGNEAPELRMEQRWYKQQNKQLAEQREEEEFINYMHSWASHKGQYEEEMIKKQQYQQHGSKFFNVQVQAKPKNDQKEVQQDDFVEKTISKEKEEENLLYNNYLKLKNVNRQEKANQKHIQHRIATFVDDSDGSMQELKDNDKKNLNASFNKLDPELSKSQINQSQNENEDQKEELNDIMDAKQVVFKDFSNTDDNLIEGAPFQKNKDFVNTIKNQSELNDDPSGVTTNPTYERLIQTSQGSRGPNKYANVRGLEDEIKKAKIAKIRLMRGKIIGQKEAKVIDAEEVEIDRRKELSISVYTKKPNLIRPGTTQDKTLNKIQSQNKINEMQKKMSINDQWKHRRQLNGQYRPFSCIYTSLSQKDVRKGELDDIKRIKNSFAKNGIRCSAQTLSMALMTPSSQPNQDLSRLPPSGMMLLQNQFAVVKKKGKKKKK